MGWTDLENVKEDTVVPLLWFEEGIDELGKTIYGRVPFIIDR